MGGCHAQGNAIQRRQCDLLSVHFGRHILEGRYHKKKRQYRNWDGSYKRQPIRFELPETLDELAELVRGAERLSCVGAGHSFNDHYLNDELLVSIDRIEGNVEFDAEAATATFRAGTRMRKVNQFIEPLGLALPLLPDHNAQSIAGVLATDVHATAPRRPPRLHQRVRDRAQGHGRRGRDP